MPDYWTIFLNGYKDYAGHLWREITHPHWQNYFYWLIGVSLFFFVIEICSPWRKKQAVLRKDFWLDFFYMFFNFFIFWLIIYNAASNVGLNFFNGIFEGVTGINLPENNPMYNLPQWSVLLLGFLIRDFVQWWIHRLLHRVPFLWEFHKVHHSVEEMGFAAHLRFHWMEIIVYRTLEYIPLALLIGLRLDEFFAIHIFTLFIGHFNHSNFSFSARWSGLLLFAGISLVCVLGVAEIEFLLSASLLIKLGFIVIMLVTGFFIVGPFMKQIFNSPEMHIWHHAKEIPESRSYGVNFGLSLAIWDYLFGTAYVPKSGRDINLGFNDLEKYPKSFWQQFIHGIMRS